jgi:DNA-binding transcriptional regulator/RsmH inhibitor MraZ
MLCGSIFNFGIQWLALLIKAMRILVSYKFSNFIDKLRDSQLRRRILQGRTEISNLDSSCMSRMDSKLLNLMIQQETNDALTHRIVRSMSESVNDAQGRIIFGDFSNRTNKLVIKVAPNACILAVGQGEKGQLRFYMNCCGD